MEILRANVIRELSCKSITAELIIQNRNGVRKMIHIETKYRMYREDLGCSIYFVNENADGFFKGKLIKEYFDNYESDIESIIKVAEESVIDRCSKDWAFILTSLIFFGILISMYISGNPPF